MNKITKALTAAALVAGGLGLAACSTDADVASHNLSKDADNFKIYRQIVVYNAITDKYILEVDGYCSLGNNDGPGQVTYTCKTPKGLVKDIIKKSDNTFVFVHQLDAAKVSTDRYRVIFKPSVVVPDPEGR